MSDYQFNPNQEQWEGIPGFPGYEVSDQGRVRSYWRNNGRKKRTIDRQVQLILKPVIKKKTKYVQHNLPVNGKFVSQKVHHLVLWAFIGPCPSGHIACHKDDNPQNNFLYNLRWDTPKGNAEDAKRNGCQNYPHGEKHYLSKLTEAEVISIRYLYSIGVKNMVLATMYKLCRSAITNIIHRKTWKHLP